MPTIKEVHLKVDQFVELPFVELLAKSNFSFLQGASHPEEMALRAQELGYKGLALCDSNGLYGLVRGWQAIEFPSHFTTAQFERREDFHFHCGVEMQLVDHSRLTLLPMHKDGYTRICQLITLSKRRSPKGFTQLSLEEIAAHSDDLLAFALPPWKEERTLRLIEIFGDRLYFPVWKDLTWNSIETYQEALKLEKRLQVQLIATQMPLMHARERKPLHDVLTCLYHKTTLREAKTRLTTNSERHLKSLFELRSLWSERLDLVTKTVEVAKRLNFSLKELQYEYPQAALPAGREPPDFLREKVYEGLQVRFPHGTPPDVITTVEKELALIAELRYEDYFLTLWDICQFATKIGVLHQGRGSAANSIVCYALGLTAVDPTKVQLVFERFLSKERGEPPDIDIDFESSRREEVIQHIYKKYGAEHAAMVCTVICYRSRMAVRDCAKVLSIPNTVVDRIIRFMGREGLSRLEESPHIYKELGLSEQQYQNFLTVSLALRGFPRHLGIHTGGFLISKRPITECVPVEKATMDDRYVIQWNKDDLNILKMLKIDVLGLGMLEALRRSFEFLDKHHGRQFDLYNIPPDDKPTYDMIQKADTVGTFQIESRAQMSLLPRLKPRNFYDLVVEVAIVRPGPIQGGMIHPFVKRRNGQENWTYAHPDLKPILEKTCGVPIFQEQVMQIASTVAGFSPGEADELRRIMSSSWKKHDLMKGMRERLLNGMIAHGIPISYAEQIYQTIVGFSAYGFPESHAASFALITYVSCYIKCHYPEVFVASLLNAQPMGFYSPRALVADAQRHQVRFLDIDIQKSDFDYIIEKSDDKWAVRVGFMAIRGIKAKHMERVLQERQRNSPFVDLEDLVKRTHLHRSTLMLLGAAGTMKSFGLSPREALWRIQALKLDPQSLFFGQIEARDEDLLPTETEWETMSREYRAKGYSLTRHPLLLLRPSLPAKHGFSTAADLPQSRHRQPVRIAGLLSLLQKPPTAKGVAFLTLEDEFASFNVVLMPDVYEKFRLIIGEYSLLEIRGSIEKKEGVIHIRAQQILPLNLKELASPALPSSTSIMNQY
jgi:DNA polymerase-3 subunit alpha/error-prone DNA polymerase